MQIAIIGAGITGLACARVLADAGLAPVVLDKGRGIGGRVATRRAAGLHFDHGAQYVSADSDDFARLLPTLAPSGAVAPWQDGTGQKRIVGTPGMSSLARGLGAGLDVRQNVQITAILPDDPGWRLQYDTGAERASHVIVTVPAPQVSGMLEHHPLLTQIAAVRYAPNLTLMAAIDGPAPFVSQRNADADLAWIAQDSSKPGRPQGDATAWVAQAGTAFSEQHLEQDKDAIADLMLPLLCERIGVARERVTYASAHRWRYAQVTQALGRPFVRTDDGRLYLGGDWCLGPKISHAWASGTAIARDFLAQWG